VEWDYEQVQFLQEISLEQSMMKKRDLVTWSLILKEKNADAAIMDALNAIHPSMLLSKVFQMK